MREPLQILCAEFLPLLGREYAALPESAHKKASLEDASWSIASFFFRGRFVELALFKLLGKIPQCGDKGGISFYIR